MRRAFNDAMVSTGALAALLTLLVAIDGRVRHQVMLRFTGDHASADVVNAGTQVRDMAGVILDVVGDAWRLHTALALFVIVATVLTVFMVRT
jgi:hypothetical protein